MCVCLKCTFSESVPLRGSVSMCLSMLKNVKKLLFDVLMCVIVCLRQRAHIFSMFGPHNTHT